MTIKKISLMVLSVVVLTLIALSAYFARSYSQLERSFLESDFDKTAERASEQVRREIREAGANLHRVRGFLSLMESGAVPPERAFATLRRLMAETIEFQDRQFAVYFALEPGKARQWFGSDNFVFGVRKNMAQSGTDAYGKPDNARDWLAKRPDTAAPPGAPTSGLYLNNPNLLQWYEATRTQRKPQVSPIFFEPQDVMNWMFRVTMGLFDENGEFIGMVGVDMVLDGMQAEIEKVRLGETGGMVLVDIESGSLLTRPRAAHGGKSGFLLTGPPGERQVPDRLVYHFYRDSSLGEGWRDILTSQATGTRYVTGDDGEMYIVSAHRLEGSPAIPWSLLAFERKSELEARLNRQLLVFGLTGLLALVALAFLYRYVRRKLLLPITGLAEAVHEAAREVEKRKTCTVDRIPVQGTSECRTLGTIFRQMIDAMNKAVTAKDEYANRLRLSNQQLAEFNRTLEKVVEERTAELKQAKEVVELASRAKSIFMGNVTHELRTPMNAIIGYSEMLIEECAENGPPRMADDLGKIRRAGMYLLGLINSVLDLSRIEAGKMELFIQDFEIRPLLRELAIGLQTEMDANSNTLVIEVGEGVATMRSDLVKVRQILHHLLANAAKFTHQGKVRLEARLSGHESSPLLIFTIRDTGIGMNTDQMERIFEPFYKADPATGSRYSGAGLGLAMCRRFCQMMGGSIRAESSPGGGSAFIVELPATLTPSGSGSSASLPDPAALLLPLPADAYTVLIVDDDPSVHDLLGRMLNREQIAVLHASGGREGLETARQRQPDAIILDVMMPDMDGWAVLNQIKADPAIGKIPVIMNTVVNDKIQGMTLGAADYLTKPINRQELLRAVLRFKNRAPAAPKTAATVLVVDDDEDIRYMLRQILQTQNWTVAEASSAEIALEMLEDLRPFLILLDIGLPGMNGIEFLHELRRRHAHADIPVVVLSAQSLSDEDRARLSSDSVGLILQKEDMTMKTLVEQIRGVTRVEA